MANNWAIVVGINHYEFLPNASLKFAAADALAMRTFLCEEAGFDSAKVTLFGNAELSAKQATRSILRDTLLNHCQDASNADNLWFFFSGHGFAGEHSEDYLITVDGNPGDLKETAISVSFVADCLRRSKAKSIVLILDMCRDEILDREKKSIVELNRAKQQAIVTIYSCDRRQSSYEISAYKQGAFTYALLEGLREKKTLGDLEKYLESRVPELHQSVGKENRRQTPRVVPDPGWKLNKSVFFPYEVEVDIAALMGRAIDAESDGDLKKALHLWNEVKESTKTVDDRQRALKKIKDLQTRLNPPTPPPKPVTPKPETYVPNFVMPDRRTPVREPEVQRSPTPAMPPKATPKTPTPPTAKPPVKSKTIDRNRASQRTFTRRKMLYVGFGSMATVGLIRLAAISLLDGHSRSITSTTSNPSPSQNPVLPSKSQVPPPPPKIILSAFSYPTIKLNPKGEIIKRETLQGQQFISAFDIKMIQIKGGTFKMGSPKIENSRSVDEGPQHNVTVLDFFMGKHPITQAQWKAVAALLKVKIDLDADPSNFKGDSLPVESVSWEEAVEFCDRLQAHTGLNYRLPSEAEWEYACRAGTETPFYFGETLSTAVANYNANYVYGSGKKGAYPQKTTAIETYPANAWGLYDMHGNVLEWCADFYHNNYDGAPTNGSVWETSDNYYRSNVLRGGCWNISPNGCRSAFRNDNRSNVTVLGSGGFRVVCSSSVPRAL